PLREAEPTSSGWSRAEADRAVLRAWGAGAAALRPDSSSQTHLQAYMQPSRRGHRLLIQRDPDSSIRTEHKEPPR
ncbi:hypothetical protein NDU88_006162, partial [Pleurodeles waltl]